MSQSAYSYMLGLVDGAERQMQEQTVVIGWQDSLNLAGDCVCIGPIISVKEDFIFMAGADHARLSKILYIRVLYALSLELY